jgi:hypothetical protein
LFNFGQIEHLKTEIKMINKRIFTIALIAGLAFANILTVSAQEVSELKAKANEFFGQRHDKVKLEEGIKLMGQIIEKEKDYETMVLQSRAYYFLAEFAENNAQRLEVYEKGVKAGEMALQTIDGFASYKKEEEAIKNTNIKHIDAVYWTAANLARWAKFTSFTKKVSSKARVKYLWDKVNELDPAYFYGGAFRFYGGYYALVPTITGEQDPAKSKEMFDKGVAAAPEYLETKVLYADAYCTHGKIKDVELFRKLLGEVLAFDINSKPELYAENKIAQEKARKLLEDEKSLFE